MAGTSESPIIVYYYDILTEPELFCCLLERRFRETGHTRPIEFRSWPCYRELPGRDGDLFIYDGITASALEEKGFLHELPDVIRTDGVFEWVLDKSKVRQKTYGTPIMLCSNVLICRKEDDFDIHSILDLHEETAIPLKSMIHQYYLLAFCNYQEFSDRCFDAIIRLAKHAGSAENLEHSRLADFDGIDRFIRKECRYFMGFTEHLRFFPKDDYAVHFVSFSKNPEDAIMLFPADFASMGNNVHEEKMLDCLDLMEIMSDEDFIYDICTANGKLQYMLPANRNVYPRLAKWDPLYDLFEQEMSREENCVFRYGPSFYEDFRQRSEELTGRLFEALGIEDKGEES